MLNIMKLLLLSLLWLTTPLMALDTGDPAPDFTCTVLTGEEISLSQYADKVVFLYTFGNGCGTCYASGFSTEVEVNQIFGANEDFQAIGMDLWDATSSTATVDHFKQVTGISYPLCLKAGIIASLYQTTIDRIFVVDQAGILRFRGTTNTENELDQAVSVINSLLGLSSVNIPQNTGPKFELKQNYPNPFNPLTKIQFSLTVPDFVSLKIFTLLGNEIQNLVSEHKDAGEYEIEWNAKGLPAGVYFVRMKAGEFVKTRKVVLQK
jgi:peroxiredoxin